jgi:hypothetical protein
MGLPVKHLMLQGILPECRNLCITGIRGHRFCMPGNQHPHDLLRMRSRQKAGELFRMEHYAYSRIACGHIVFSRHF